MPLLKAASVAALVIAGIGLIAGGGSRSAKQVGFGPAPPGRCDLVASTRGSDSRGEGSLGRPYRTPQKLLALLEPGQTGCLRGGHYASLERIKSATPAITLRSYPGERATVRGRLWILGDNTTIRDLDLDGSCPVRGRCDPLAAPSPLINARGVVLLDNDIQDRHTGICVSATTYRGVAPDLVVIKGNRIHDCGRLPPTNHQHGIYIVSGTGAIIADNVIFANADRGIQLFPAVTGARIYANTIDGNGEGVIVSDTSSVNQFASNIISNSNVRWNVEWNQLSGAANTITANCLYASNRRPYFNRDGGVQIQERNRVVLAANQVANPGFANRGARDYRISPTSPCRGRGAPDQVAGP